MKIQVVSDRRLNQGFGLLCSLPLSLLLGVGAAVSAASTEMCIRDSVITFNELSISAIEPIVDLQLEQVRDRLQARHITLDVTPAAMEHLAIDGYDPVYGARPLKRLIQREVVDRIAEKVISGELRDRSHVLIDLDAEGDYTCRVEGPMDLDGLNLDDPSFLTAGSDPKETLQDLDTLSNGDLGEDPIA